MGLSPTVAMERVRSSAALLRRTPSEVVRMLLPVTGEETEAWEGPRN